MTEEEYLRKRMNMIEWDSHYGIMVDTEITKIVRDYIKRLEEEATMHADCEFCIKRNICTRDVPKPCKYRYTEEERIADQASDICGNILYATRLPKTYQKNKEDNKMEATSTETFKDIIAIDFELKTFLNEDNKFIISATNRDDIFCFVFEGPYIADACRKAGLFSGWEKDQKIRELEEELGERKKEVNDCLKEAANCLNLVDEVRREKNKEINELNQQLQQAEHDKKRLTWKNEQLKQENEKLKKELSLEKAANEAQRKFIKEYAGKGTEIEFNYAIGDDDEDTYVIVNKEEYKALKNIQNNVKNNGCYNVLIDGKIYNLVQLMDRIQELEALKTPTIENFADEEPSSRRDILRCAEKCVCGKREQDYGTPESNFQLIADLWNDYLKKERSSIVVDAKDVAMMMALMKIARIRNGGGSGDSFVDLAGYAACGGEIWAGEKKQKDQN